MHHEVLDVYLLYLQPFVGKITVFTTSAVKILLSDFALDSSIDSSIDFYLQSPNFSFNDWLDQHSDILSAADVCIVTTHQISLNEYVNPSKMKNPLLVVHNTFSTFYPYKHLYLGKKGKDFFYDCLRLMRSFILGYDRKKKHSLSGYHGFISTSPQQYAYVASHFPELKTKFIPGSLSYFLQFSNPQNSDRIKIVIPGTVDVEVRDYEIVYQALKRLSDLSKFELIFLGKIKNEKSRKVIQAFSALVKAQNMNFITFEETIQTEIYNDYLFQADFFLLPNKQIIRDGISYSIIGESSISGTIADAFLYAKPCIMPDYLKVPSPLAEISEKYSGLDELSALIDRWMKKENLQKVYSKRKADQWQPYEHSHIGQLLAENLKQFTKQ